MAGVIRILARSTLLVLSIFILASSAVAETRIAVVDIERALGGSAQGKEASEAYQEKVKQAQEQIDEKKGEYERLKEAFIKQRDTLNESARLEKEEKLISLEKELKRSFSDSQESLRRTHMQLVGELVKDMRVVVEKLGKEKGFDIILDRRSEAVIFASDAVDLTDEVMKRFSE